MTGGQTDGDRRDLDGLSPERAAGLVVEDAADTAAVRETLAIVARDGTIRREAVDDAVANASMVATTAETRSELAAEKLDDVRGAAAELPDLPFVAGRVENFESRLDTVERRAGDLGDAIQAVVERKEGGDLYAIARRIRRLTNAATEVQRAADDFQLEVDAFEAWLGDADRRVEKLAADLDAVRESVDELERVPDALATADTDADRDAGAEWAAATVRHRVVSLLIADLEAELEAVRALADGDRETPSADFERRLDEVRTSNAAAGERLAARAEPEWADRFDDRLDALDDALDDMRPPVARGEVEAVVSEHRPAVE